MNNIHKRAVEITDELTLKEKIGQISQVAAGYRCYTLTEGGDIEFSEEFVNTVKEYGGLGAISGILRADPWSGRYYGTGITLDMREKIANKIQAYIEENTRMKLPVMVEVEASHGLQSLGSVMYPTGLASAASFNPNLYGEMMEAIGQEIEASGNHVAFLTLIDLARDPRWGRCEECLGEDPFLASEMAAAAVTNIKKSNVLACAKHFAAAGACEGGVNCGEIHIGPRELKDLGLPAAKASVDAGCDMIMVAYNSIDGTPVHVDGNMLTNILRGELGFDGIIISDGDAVRSASRNLGLSAQDTAVLCIKAGVDLSLADSHCFTELENAVNTGTLDISYIDKACVKVIEKKLELGLFEKRYIAEGSARAYNEDKHCERIAYKMAAESITMIKNENALPISKTTKVALIGENAVDIYHTLGDYTSERLSDEGTTIYNAIKDRFKSTVFAEGWNYNRESDINEAIKAAEEADVIIFAAGGTSRRDFDAKYLSNGAVSESKSYMDCGEGLDLASIQLHSRQLELLRKLKEVGKPIISVVIMGRAYVLKELEELSDAVLVAWYPGQEGGYAIADIIAGDVNPSGKLSVTLPSHTGVYPVCHDAYPIWRHYFDSAKPILYPFGYGLSYSRFEYSDLETEKTAEGIKVEFNVTNISDIEGKEVVQIYITPSGDSVAHRRNQLKGFSKINLKPNECRRLKFFIAYKEIGFIKPITPRVEISIGPDEYEKFEKLTIEI